MPGKTKNKKLKKLPASFSRRGFFVIWLSFINVRRSNGSPQILYVSAAFHGNNFRHY